jgi:tetratricopeptide (TPR) repeat protein
LRLFEGGEENARMGVYKKCRRTVNVKECIMEKIETILQSADALCGAGAWDAAIRDYTDVIRLDTNNVHAYAMRGLAYKEKGDYDRTIEDCAKAIRLDPNCAPAYTGRSIVYLMKGDYDRAIADSNELIRLDSNDTEAYTNRGFAYLRKYDYDKAIADSNEAIRLDPNNAKAYYNRCLTYGKKKVYDKATADLEMAVKLSPDNAEWREELDKIKAAIGNSGNTVHRVPSSTAEAYGSSSRSSGKDIGWFGILLYIAWRISKAVFFFFVRVFSSLGGKIGGGLGLVLMIYGIVYVLIAGDSGDKESIASMIFSLISSILMLAAIGYGIEKLVIFIKALVAKKKK